MSDADVIEQLRSDLALRDQTARDRKTIIAELEAENRRLRALKTPASSQLLNITKACSDNAEDEIDRLRTESGHLREIVHRIDEENERLRADKAELVAVLKEIVDEWLVAPYDVKGARRIARAAIAKVDHDG